MQLHDLLALIKQTGINNNTSIPMICGGIVRDKVLNIIDKIEDLDITTGDSTIKILSKELYILLNKSISVSYKEMDDGHSSIFVGNFKIDFSSNFVLPQINKFLFDKNIKHPTNMEKELFSRDFTCNALLMDLDLKNIFDLTRNGLNDIKNKTINTCLSPDITLLSNKNRVIRAIYLAAKLDFSIHQSIIDYVLKNPSTVQIASQKTLIEKINKALDYNPDKTIFYLNKMNLWNYIPITDKLKPYYINSLKGKI